MSIATEIQAYNNGLKAVYNKISEKGGTIPPKKNLNNLPSAVESISGGEIGDYADTEGLGRLYYYSALDILWDTTQPFTRDISYTINDEAKFNKLAWEYSSYTSSDSRYECVIDYDSEDNKWYLSKDRISYGFTTAELSALGIDLTPNGTRPSIVFHTDKQGRNIVTYDIMTSNDFLQLETVSGQANLVFSDLQIPVDSVVGFKFNKDFPYSAIGDRTSGYGGLFCYMKNLEFIGQIPDTITSIGCMLVCGCPNFNSYFSAKKMGSLGRTLVGCDKFNSPVSLPSLINISEKYFLCSCKEFNERVDLSSFRGTNRVPQILNECPNMTSEVIFNKTLTYAGWVDNYSFATVNATDPAYVEGIKFVGKEAQQWADMLGNRTTSPYRKIIVGQTN